MPVRLVGGFTTRVLILISVLLLGAGVSVPRPAGAKGTGSPPHSPGSMSSLAGWLFSGSLFILTTPEGANLPSGALERDFPLLVRLNRDVFDFRQARPDGADLRFSTVDGAPLKYQIEEWDPAAGTACIWVRIPLIRGNDRQEIRMHWGQPDAPGESDGSAVFNATNGYLSVWHLTDPVKDEVGTLVPKDTGTLSSPGIIGKSRRFSEGEGLNAGEKITAFPTGSSPHTSEVWFRAERPNATMLAWGNEQAQGKVVMQLASPPHIRMDCYFSDGNVRSNGTLPLGEWTHVAHTYQRGESRVYVNGVLDGVSVSAGSPLSIKSPARMDLGGWYGNYNFVGDLDEARISRVTRSADWLRLQYENQKPQQTLVGPPVQGSGEFSVSPSQLVLPEGQSAILTAEMGGAQKLYWVLKRDGRATTVAVDRTHFSFDAARVAEDTTVALEVRAVYPDGIRSREIPITIKEAIPDPVFSLQAPSRWDGRKTIQVRPRIANLAQIQAQGAGKLHYTWSVSGLAVIQEAAPDRLILKRAQNSGEMTVTLSLDNGGAATVHRISLPVTEPKQDPWLERVPAADEKAEENQFYARNDRGEGTLHYNGSLATEHYPKSLASTAGTVFLKLYSGEQLLRTVSRKLPRDRSYALSVKLRPGLIRYRVEFGVKQDGAEAVLRTVSNLVCGDAFLINGQSNAEATAWGEGDFPYTNEWIRSFGSRDGDPKAARLKLWGNAAGRSPGGKLQIGYWGMELARRLVEARKVPICILNGAVGGTRIDQHQRSSKDPEDAATIYGRLLWRVRQAGLTHGIRGILWHQGENDQGADGPTGGYGWETYEKYFVELSAAWKEDFPNVQRYYVFQIWPRSCGMGINGSDNRLREVQRRLPSLYSRMSVMSTLGVRPPGGCHFPPEGYAEIARLVYGLVERDSYGKVTPEPAGPPNLQQAYYSDEKRSEVTLEFDQPIAWAPALVSQFYLDGAPGKVVSGDAQGNRLLLKLASPAAARRITYLDSRAWNENNLLYGRNGIAALTFCEVPLLSQNASRARALRSPLR